MMTDNFRIYCQCILTFFGILFTSILYSQSKDNAALYAIWSDTSNTGIERIDAYFVILNDFKVFLNANPEESKWFAASNEAIELAIKHDKKEYLPLFYLASSYKYGLLQNDIASGCVEAKKVIESAKQANTSVNAVFIANLILFQQCSSTAIETDNIGEFNRITKTLSDTPEDLEILRDLNAFLGHSLMVKDQYPKALMYTLESLRLSEELNLIDASYSISIQTLAIIHSNIGNYKDAEIYSRKSLDVSNKIKDTMNIGGSYIGMAELMVNLKDEIKAQYYIDSAIYIMRDVKLCEPCYNLAKIVNAGIKNLSGNYFEALIELNEVEAYFKTLDMQPTPEFYIEKGRAYLGQNQYDDAIQVLNSSKALENVYFKTASDKYSILIKAYEAKKDFKQALEYYKLYVQVEDSLTGIRNSSEVTRLALENQFTQQQLKADLDFQAQLNKQKTTKNWLMFSGIAILLFAAGLFSRLQFIRKTQKLLKRKNEIIELEKEKAQSSERAKHLFLANMSHEIRTPMNAIKGMTDILIRRNPKDDQKEYLNSIKQSSDSLLVIINDILDISKIEAGKIELENEAFSVIELMDNVHTIMQFKAEEKGLELRKNIPAEDLNVTGDATRLRQILLNLIGNAIKFTEKGLVTTTIKSENIDDKLHLHFTVSDTGIGVDDDRMDKIFNSFEQAYSDTSRKFGGTGLGLSISRMLVELHQGKIWVESEKGKGSKFHFTIPYEKGGLIIQERKPEHSNNNIAEELKGIKILLVEDNMFNVVVAREELEDAIEDVKVELAENGAIAVERLKSSKFDIILMDVQMPTMNGYEATKAIRALNLPVSLIPIIAMTANVLKEEVELCYQAGMNDFIGKPFDTEELLHKINLLIKKG